MDPAIFDTICIITRTPEYRAWLKLFCMDCPKIVRKIARDGTLCSMTCPCGFYPFENAGCCRGFEIERIEEMSEVLNELLEDYLA